MLDADKWASEAKLKRAYHKKSLIHHPDRPSGDKDRFQTLGAVYNLLSDKDRRYVYDKTSDIDEGEDMDPDKDWDLYWRLLFNYKMRREDPRDQEHKLRERQIALDREKKAREKQIQLDKEREVRKSPSQHMSLHFR